jgi:hypothetical protein
MISGQKMKLIIITIIKHHNSKHYIHINRPILTVVKELRSKMFGQHPGYFKAVFLKQTRIIIVSIYKKQKTKNKKQKIIFNE